MRPCGPETIGEDRMLPHYWLGSWAEGGVADPSLNHPTLTYHSSRLLPVNLFRPIAVTRKVLEGKKTRCRQQRFVTALHSLT